MPQQCREHCRSRHHATQQHSSAAVEELVLDEEGPESIFVSLAGFSCSHGLRYASPTTADLSSSQIEIDAIGFTARLTHLKPLGSDRNVTMRLVVIDKNCFVQRDGWMSAGWSLLCREAPFVTGLPHPPRLLANCGSCKKHELKYAVGSAIQTRVLSILSIGREPLFRHRVARTTWTSATVCFGISEAGA